MASKNISITNEIYLKLKRIKHPNESFSGVISRLLDKNRNPFNFIGIWEDWDEFDTFEEGIKKGRKEDNKRNENTIEMWK